MGQPGTLHGLTAHIFLIAFGFNNHSLIRPGYFDISIELMISFEWLYDKVIQFICI